ncbi:hypothetical protein SAMN02745866_00899 [Alteromonadaceae bacterium Bs31]|nr:hypothetical protein SAMN02745866_00899 [Alteromonadaceae bacterium Bs31]
MHLCKKKIWMTLGALTVIAFTILIWVMISGDTCLQGKLGGLSHKSISGNNNFFYACQGRVYIKDAAPYEYIHVPAESPATLKALVGIFAIGRGGVYYVAEIGNDLWGGNELRTIYNADKATFEVTEKRSARDKNYEYSVNIYGELKVTPINTGLEIKH